MNEVNAVEIVRPTFDNEIIVKIPKNIPKIEHNLGGLKDFAIKLKDFYSHLVFTDDNISEAQEEKTRLNKLINEVKRQRIDNITEYKKPIEDFEKTAKEIETLLNDAKSCVQVFIDNAENTRKTEKREKVILPIINECINNAFIKDNVLIDINKILIDDRWFNKTFKDKDIEEDVNNQVAEIIKAEEEYQKGLGIIKSTIKMASQMSINRDYDKYVERFKFTRDLTSVLDAIKNENEKRENSTEQTTIIDNKTMFDNVKEKQTINNVSTDAVLIKTFRGTEQQMYKLCQYALQLGMEVVENGFY